MTPTQIKQVLNIRMLRAEAAERAFLSAQAAEQQAVTAVQAAEGQLAAFDVSFQAKVSAFLERSTDGTRPESLHSARSFHADLARERTAIEVLIPQAWRLVEIAREYTATARATWVAATQAADKIEDIYTQTVQIQRREQERVAERDADELSIARAYRNAG